MQNKRSLVLAIVFFAAIVIAFTLPKPKYVSLDILSKIKVPEAFGEWTSEDISSKLDQRGQQYNFINRTFARIYKNAEGQEILLMILDAGNFHNPKVCYGSSGYITNDMNSATIALSTKKFQANTVYLEKDKTRLTVLYWLCIDKKLVSWTEQKVQELFASLFNRKKAGLMVRIDVPTDRESKAGAIALAQKFVSDLSQQLSREDEEYIFGK